MPGPTTALPTAGASAPAFASASPPQIQRQVALGVQVSRVLRAEILTGALPVGTLLVEASLAARFGVSRGPVRDALRTLAGEGLIVSSGRSYRVVGLDERDVRQLYALRELLEVYACQQAASADPAACRAAAEAAIGDMDAAARAHDPSAFARADIEFHSAFYRASGNDRLCAVWEQHVATFSVLFQLTDALDDTLSISVGRHRALLGTILGGDPDAIAAEVAAHLAAAQERIINAHRHTSPGTPG
ncbi:MAG TPA: GntR family transcriptional regulator [Pseudonocardia sp.]|uniref:GntR family transcriptional regulator n=1 Tax=Pseudonocardia sp. TaxID=60912 RepID=UPI002C756FA0|nr:GntR family transcriptional regulator [Pseudonocardia sp.]HTF49925.1 GntR family transcriptional regulator [Pseudonocardia sp.]